MTRESGRDAEYAPRREIASASARVDGGGRGARAGDRRHGRRNRARAPRRSSAVELGRHAVEPRTHLERRTSRLSLRGGSNPREARRDGRDARRGARVAVGRWLHARQRVSRETSARQLSSFLSRCRSEVFPTRAISAPPAPTEGRSRLLRWQGESSCSFRAFRKRAVVFALDFLLLAQIRPYDRALREAREIPKLEPIRSRLPVFPIPRSTRVSKFIPPNPSHRTTVGSLHVLSILDEFFRARFRTWDLRPHVRLDRHTRTHLTWGKSHPTSQWLPLPCLWPLSRPPSSARTVRLQGHPRLRGRAHGGWRRATLQVRTPAMRPPAPSIRRRTPDARDDRASASTPPDARLDERARVPPSSSRRPQSTRGGTGSRDVSKNASHRTDAQSSACRRAGERSRTSPRARVLRLATARFRRRTPR